MSRDILVAFPSTRTSITRSQNLYCLACSFFSASVRPRESVPLLLVSLTKFPPAVEVVRSRFSENVVNIPFVVSPRPCVSPVTVSPTPFPVAVTTLPAASVTVPTPLPRVFVAAPRVLPGVSQYKCLRNKRLLLALGEVRGFEL